MPQEISIIVPVYNRSHLVEACLDSVKSQTYRPLHLIIVDNNSTDDTFRVISEWGGRNASATLRVSILKEPRQGASAARNRGLQAADGDFLMFLDSDDAMRPTLTEQVAKAIAAAPDTDIVSWRSQLHELGGGCRTSRITAPGHWLHNQIVHSVLNTDAYAVRRSFFNLAGTWDTALAVWDDWELGIRLLTRQPKITFINEVLLDVYANTVSITGENFHSKSGRWEEAIRHAMETIEQSQLDDKKHWLNMLQYRRIILAARYRREKKPETAARLLDETMKDFDGSRLQRLILKACYHYTRLGGRGASYWSCPLL